jgi:peptide/nickel transport system permease protein
VLLYGKLGILPGSGRLDVDAPPFVTGFLLIDSLLTLDFRAFIDALRHLALPVLTLSLVEIGGITRLVRAQMLEVLNEDYVRTARASGLPERTVRRLALRNALIPLVTVLGLAIAGMLYGSVVIESVFGWPGTGSYVVTSIFNLDFAVVFAFATLTSFVYVIINLLVDLTYLALDPRIRNVS